MRSFNRLPGFVFFISLIWGLATLIGCGGNPPDSSSISSFSGSFVESGRLIPDLASYRIAYYEALPETSPEAGGTITETDEPFRLVDYGPEGELPPEIKKPSIYVVFSQPVVPLARLGDPIRSGTPQAANLFSIDPPLPGVFRWYGSKLLAFESDDEKLPQRRYTVTVSDQMVSLGGKKLEGPRSFSFETERLSVLSWQLGDGESWVNSYDAHPAEAKNMVLIFSYPVNLEEIKNWIEIRADGRTWPFRVSRPAKIDEKRFVPEQGVLLVLEEQLPMNTRGTLAILPGARSEPDFLGAREEKTFSFHTLFPFQYEEISARSTSSPRTEEGASIPILISFSHPVDPGNGTDVFSIAGFPPLKAGNVHVYGSTVVLNQLPLEYGKSYQVRISADLKDLWGRPLGQEKNVAVRIGDANSYVYIGNRGSRMLEAGFPPRVVWEAQNPVSVKRIIRGASGPYERAPSGLLQAMDMASFPRNSKQYFMEDLSPFLGPGAKGSAALAWEYTTRSNWGSRSLYEDQAWLTVQVTDIGLTVRYGYNRVVTWATRLSTGEGVADAQVMLLAGDQVVREGRTDAQGLAVFDFPDGDFAARFAGPSSLRSGNSPEQNLRIRVVEAGGAQAGGDEVEFIPNNSHNIWRFDVDAAVSPLKAETERPVVFLFTDRGIYRPGETVTFRGIDRRLLRGQYQAYQGPYTLEVSSGAYQAPVIASLSGDTTGTGGSHGSFTLPADLDPGRYTLRYTRQDAAQAITFLVANFERLRVSSSLSFPETLSYQGESITGHFSASYLAGGVLAGAPYSYYWTREPAAFNPGGPWQYWRFGPELSDGRYYADRGEGTLGPDGSVDISTLPPVDGIEGALYRYRLEASAQDAARQEISSRGFVMVHPASFYIASRLDPVSGGIPGAPELSKGLPAGNAASRPSAYFLAGGSPAALSWTLVSPEGLPYTGALPQAGTLAIQLIRHDWKQARQAGIGGRVNLLWERVEELVDEQTVDLAGLKGDRAGIFSFTPDKGGQWELRLRSLDHRGRPVLTRQSFYVSGAGWVRWGSDDVDRITLTADKGVYAPGDTARLMVRSPLPKGKYLLTIEREKLISEKIIELDGSARTIDIPIEESYTPIVYVALSSYTVRSAPPNNSYYEPDLDKPKGLFGLTSLSVDNAGRHYTIEIEPSQGVYGPAGEAEIRLTVSLDGKPAAGTELTFMAVDRGVVDLIDYHVPDPLAYFYDSRNFPLGVQGADSRSLLIDPVTYALSDLQGGDDEDSSKLDERKDFRPTAVFEPYLVTGSDGTVTVKFKLPDSLTTYRCTAVAVGREEFGLREQDLRVSAPLTAVAVLPRKLRWRDTGTVSLILTNLEKEAVEARVSLAIEDIPAPADGPGSLWDTVLEVDGESDKTLRIPPGAAREVSFRTAAVGSGEAQLAFTLRSSGVPGSSGVNERIIRTLTVDRPLVYETVSAIGNLGPDDSFVEEGVVIPSLVPEGTGTFSLSLSASRLANLKETVQYLLDYPYGCLEQRTARLLPLIAFEEYLDTFGLDTPVRNPKKVIEDELAWIAKNQLADGSYPYWPGGQYGNFLVTLRTAHITALARTRGYAIPPAMDVPALLRYITTSESARRVAAGDPFLRGYSLWVRTMYGEKIGTEISAFLRQGDELGIAGWSFAGLAALELGMKDLAVSTRDRVKRFIRPGTRTLDLTDTYEQRGNFWGTDTDRYALALMLFHTLYPDDDMTTRLATALLERQRRGLWTNTASSYWAVLAFARIAGEENAGAADAAGRTVPAVLQAQTSLGGSSLLGGEFSSAGVSPLSRTWTFPEPPLEGLSRDTLLPLRIERTGQGRLFYTASLRYGIPTELAGRRDEGLGVFPETFDADGNPVQDGRLIPGQTYTRRIVVSSSRDRTFVALRAPVPSGAEIVDALFVTSSTRPPEEDPGAARERREAGGRSAEYDPYAWDNTVPVRFIMDDEVRFHWDAFPAGKREVEFRFRAVMPGIYPTPPAQAECMYEPEVFGRSA
ncbi:MAG: alpha-2-macroglobulin, partial [Treponema sp.]|nr:alpha-2-macroglobulin [Treponema sp.]